MRLQDIKTRTEFYEFADIQYQRVHSLRCIWQNEIETKERKVKAFRLWGIMFKRVLRLSQIAAKINQPKKV